MQQIYFPAVRRLRIVERKSSDPSNERESHLTSGGHKLQQQNIWQLFLMMLSGCFPPPPPPPVMSRSLQKGLIVSC